jgi:hypothetical protein
MLILKKYYKLIRELSRNWMAFNEVINLNTGLQSQAHALDFIFL